MVARWACIPFSILGGYICFRWARELYGVAAGIFALILWCFCPYVLGHASLFTPDAHAAAIGIAAYYLFWRWLGKAQLSRAILAGIALGVAELAKFTLLVFYPLWIVTWFIYRLPDFGLRNMKGWLHEGEMVLWMMLVSVGVLNLGYGFEGSSSRSGGTSSGHRLLSGIESKPDIPAKPGNRFADTWWASLPVPLPANYVQGIDTQRCDFERKLWSYLGGQWRDGGWWYYYLYALGIKLPLGTLCLILISVPCGFWSKYRPSWRNEVVLLLPIVGHSGACEFADRLQHSFSLCVARPPVCLYLVQQAGPLDRVTAHHCGDRKCAIALLVGRQQPLVLSAQPLLLQ